MASGQWLNWTELVMLHVRIFLCRPCWLHSSHHDSPLSAFFHHFYITIHTRFTFSFMSISLPIINPPPKPKPTPAPTPSLFKFLHTTTSTSPTFPSLSKLWGLINYRFLISIYTHIYMITILSISKSKRTTQTWTPQKTGLSQ